LDEEKKKLLSFTLEVVLIILPRMIKEWRMFSYLGELVGAFLWIGYFLWAFSWQYESCAVVKHAELS